MAQFKLERFTYSYAGDWEPNKAYKLDDIVTVNGNVYFCNKAHTSQTDFYLDFLYEFTYPAPYTAANDIDAEFDFSIDVGGENTTVDGSGLDFTVTRSGNRYSVAIVEGGRNYVTKEYFRIPGDQLGGVRGTNDAIVTIDTIDNVEDGGVITPGVVQSLSVTGTPALTKWEIQADGLSWQGEWQPSTGVPGTEPGDAGYPYVPKKYYINDLVFKSGNVYKCVQGHIASTDSTYGLENNIQYWTLQIQGNHWRGAWTGFTGYNPGDVVTYNGTIWRCVTSHQSDTIGVGLDGDAEKWLKVSESDYWRDSWQPLTRYRDRDIVTYGGIVYRCINPHTSGDATAGLIGDDGQGTFQDLGKWQVVVDGIRYTGDWQPSTKYYKNDIVRFSQNTYKATDYFTSDVDFDSANWEIYVPGMAYEDLWNLSTEYQPGDIVQYGGYTYYSKTFNENRIPPSNNADWEILGEWYNIKGQWSAIQDYKVGDVVSNNGYMYWCVSDNTGDRPDSGNNAQTYNIGFKNGTYTWNGVATPDLTFLRGTTITLNQSSLENNGNAIYPATEVDGELGVGVEVEQGYSVTYILDGEVVPTKDKYASGFNSASDRKVIIQIQPDAPGNLYFASYSNTGASGNQTITIAGSSNWDVLMPGTFFKGTWNDFEEDSSVTEYQIGDIATWAGTSYRCFKRHTANIQYSRPDEDVRKNNPEYWTVYIQGIRTNVLAQKGDIKTYQADSDIRVPIGDPSTVLKGLDQINADSSTGPGPQWQLFNESDKVYFVSLDGVDSPERGKTETSAFRTIKYACDFIQANPGARAPATIFVSTGEFKEELPIKVPNDVAVVGHELRSTRVVPKAGFEDTDMFHVKNGCGLRNMTMQGLVGTLGSPNEFGTRRPVDGGPSFVSLDPGSGPSDNSVWVYSKSTYVQNVTTIGVGCVGMKVDGQLHGGGNKSIVANDFTQVISGGIGMWITNGGLSELVSVFTYYCHIGYLAEVGGKIRATNGNNSYGDYGSVAEGFDLLETPITSKFDNRSTEATVTDVLTDLDDQIYLFGYGHAGQEYTSAKVQSFSGTGFGLSTEYTEFRNGALSEVRMMDPGDSSTPGGAGYSVATGQASAGDSTGLILDATDTVEDSTGVYDGKRIILTQGKGKGQYAKVLSFDPSTKRCEIVRESDGLPGWDHWIPGTPIVTALDETSSYRIEPMVEFNEPPYSQSQGTLPTPLDYKRIRYGGGKFVAIAQSEFGRGNTNQFLYSTDGVSWTTGTFDGSALFTPNDFWSWSDLAYSGSTWVAVAKEGIVATSTDGVSWSLKEVSTDSTAPVERFIEFGANPVTSQSYKVTVSIPGDNPLYHFDGATNSAPDITLVAGNTYIFNQNDASNLSCPIYFATTPLGHHSGDTPISEGIKYFLDNVQVANLEAYVSGFDAAQTKRVEWTVPTNLVGVNVYYVNYNSTGSNVQTDSSYALVTIDSEKEFCVVGRSNAGSYEWWQSTDEGSTWTVYDLPSKESNPTAMTLTYGSGKFVITTKDYDSSVNRIYIKTPGQRSWREEFIGGADLSNVESAVYGNNLFIATETNSNNVFINPNGGEGQWYQQSGVLPTTGNWKLGYGQGVFVAFKPNSTEFAFSEDGIRWKTKTLSTSAKWEDIGFGDPDNDGKFILIGSGTPLQGAGEQKFVTIKAGRKPLGRVNINNNRVSSISIYDPGSNYVESLPDLVTNYNVTVARNTADDADVFYINGSETPALSFVEGKRYVFDQSDSSNVNGEDVYPLVFATDSGLNSIIEVNVIYRLGGVNKTRQEYVSGFASASERTVEIEIQFNAEATYYYGSSELAGMGNSISVSSSEQLAITITDPLATNEPTMLLRLANGVLPQPSFINRGTSFRSATATITGNGFADKYQVGKEIVVKELSREPGPGDNLAISGITQRDYLVTKVTNVQGVAPNLTATIQVSPPIGVDESPEHETEMTIRQKYSQVRLTFHDFLDIGTGNKNSTRYPVRYLEGFLSGSDNSPRQFNETDFSNGGRVFYSSTDQDGNFRVGELFEVEQASGIVTINADQFELDGLTELSLGGVTLGGTGAVIREFSIDPLFTANSDEIVPTQKAISAYVKSRITGGGSSVNVNKATAGVVVIGGTSGQSLETSDLTPIQIKTKMSFQGGVGGSMAAMAFFAFGTDIPMGDDMGGTDELGGDAGGHGF